MAKKNKKNSKKSSSRSSAKKTVKKAKRKAAKKAVKKSIKKGKIKKTYSRKTVKPAPKKAAKKKAKASSAKSKTSGKSKPVKEKKTNSVKKNEVQKFVPHTTSLIVGMPAPDFKGINQHGNEIKLSDFAGKKLILYFYPKDDTPGCTAEACNLRDHLSELSMLNMEVVGVSADDVDSHKKFAEKYNLPFHLISDTQKEIIRAYDVWGKKQFMGNISEGIIRTTFIIDETGNILHIIHNVDTQNHAEQIKKLLQG